MDIFKKNNIEMLKLIDEWELTLVNISEDVICQKRNHQNRTIKETLGHMIDSATNNTHRIIHLQYQNCPLVYPDYANLGSNDKWIAIQNYNNENWKDLVQLWKYTNIHIAHVITNIDASKLKNEWISALNEKITLENMVLDYLRHFKHHLHQIDELINL